MLQPIFRQIMCEHPSSNLMFIPVTDDGKASGGTRYGRPLFGRKVRIYAELTGWVGVSHPVVLLTEEVYAELHELGCKTND